VTLLDENDNRPQFVKSVYKRTILDTTPVNDTILTVAADDADVGMNHLISFYVTNATQPGLCRCQQYAIVLLS